MNGKELLLKAVGAIMVGWSVNSIATTILTNIVGLADLINKGPGGVGIYSGIFLPQAVVLVIGLFLLASNFCCNCETDNNKARKR